MNRGGGKGGGAAESLDPGMVIGLWLDDDPDLDGEREQLLVSFSVDEL